MSTNRIVITSAVRVNGEAVPPRFAPIEIGGHHQITPRVQNVPDGFAPTAVTLVGPALLDEVRASLEFVACKNLLNRAARQNLSGFREAVVMSGELVKFSLPLEGIARVGWGIITDLVIAFGPSHGVREQQIDFVFHPVDRLRFIGSMDYLEPGDE